MADMDKGARYATRKLDEFAYVREFVGEKLWEVWRFGGWLDSQAVPFPKEPDRRYDTLAWFDRTDVKCPPMAVALEFVARARTSVLPRMAEYTVRIYREIPFQKDPFIGYQTIGIIVNLAGVLAATQWAMSPIDTSDAIWGNDREGKVDEANQEQVENLGLQLRFGVRNLERRSATGLLQRIRSGRSRTLLALLPLYAGADDKEIPRQWGELVGGIRNDGMLADVVGLTRLFALHVGRIHVWDKALESMHMDTSPFLDEIRAEGELRNARTYLLSALQSGLKAEVPADLQEKVHKEKDRAKIDVWFAQTLAAGLLDEAKVRALLVSSST